MKSRLILSINQRVMKRVIKDYKSIGVDLVQLLIKTFPDGIYEDDLISIKKPNGDKINVIELRTKETIYLIKMNQELQRTIDSFTGEFEGLDPFSDGYSENPS